MDSRAVKPGDLFFALAGAKTYGARFIDAAIAAGAVAVAGNHPPQGLSVPFVAMANPSCALALSGCEVLSATAGDDRCRHRHQRQDLGRRIHAANLGAARTSAASVGTIGLVSPARTMYGSLTTPDPISLLRQLDEMR